MVHTQPLTHHFEPLNFDRTALDRLRTHLKQSPTRWRRQVSIEDITAEKYGVHKSEKSDRTLHQSTIASADYQFFSRWSPSLNEKRSTSLPFEDDDDKFRKKNQHKRSLPSIAPIHFELTFHAHQRTFKLRLHVPNVSQVFAPDAEFESTSRGHFQYPTNHVLSGHIAGLFLQKTFLIRPIYDLKCVLTKVLLLFLFQMKNTARWKVS